MFSLMRDFNDDPFFSGPMESMRRMESMMDSMMSPFGMFGGQRAAIEGGQPNRNGSQNMLMPFGFGSSLFPNMDDMFANFSQMSNNPNCHSFSSSSVMTYTTDESGRPQVYQASSSTRTAPGGVKETRRSVQDSRTGLQEMAIGHHLNDRGHVIEKKKNRYTGDEEENHEYLNLDEEEAEQFNQEWQQKAQSFNSRPMRSMLGYDSRRTYSPSPEVLAITDGSSSESTSGKKKSGKHKRKHGLLGSSSHKTSNSHARPSPYQ
ncbi:myeloid leukemia factor 1-like [Stegodyphus dumicola]|uniref:myeloid leukemia factor 1-like n=1 Tax=Stegodyphus dumicola TaxID=202533 RepID=UPI0015ABDF04|nr:myeloid leukemia factor 1-like [Stegodyphus dumicola]